MDAHLATDMQIAGSDGSSCWVNVVNGVPTLVNPEVDAVIIGDLGGNSTSGAQVVNRPIPLSAYREVMGANLEDLGKRLYVPVFDFSNDVAALTALEAAADGFSPDGADAPGGAGGSSEEDFEHRRQILLKGPVLVFLMIAAADGEVDTKEVTAFMKILSQPGAFKDPLFQALLAGCAPMLRELTEEILSSGIPTAVHMALLLRELDRLPAEEAESIRENLYRLGHKIANASGGFFGLGSKISAEEKQSLSVLSSLLVVDPSKLGL